MSQSAVSSISQSSPNHWLIHHIAIHLIQLLWLYVRLFFFLIWPYFTIWPRWKYSQKNLHFGTFLVRKWHALSRPFLALRVSRARCFRAWNSFLALTWYCRAFLSAISLIDFSTHAPKCQQTQKIHKQLVEMRRSVQTGRATMRKEIARLALQTQLMIRNTKSSQTFSLHSFPFLGEFPNLVFVFLHTSRCEEVQTNPRKSKSNHIINLVKQIRQIKIAARGCRRRWRRRGACDRGECVWYWSRGFAQRKKWILIDCVLSACNGGLHHRGSRGCRCHGWDAVFMLAKVMNRMSCITKEPELCEEVEELAWPKFEEESGCWTGRAARNKIE